jgi:ABC-type phosphate/phosphonate transport system substrate-binding protein
MGSNEGWIAALPMYDFPELAAAHDALWGAVAARLAAAGVTELPRELTRNVAHLDVWRHPRLLLGQGCEYPLIKSCADSIRLIATPSYAVPGCTSSTYRSAVVVRRTDPAEALAGLRYRRCVINDLTSNSGMNLLRAAIAPLSRSERFFESVTISGAHRRSAEMVAGGQADVAALDCVSFAHFQRLYPALMANLRVLCWTPASPSPPFITARATNDETLRSLRRALVSVMADSTLAAARERLFLDAVDIEPDDSCREVLMLERQAAEFGYQNLV